MDDQALSPYKQLKRMTAGGLCLVCLVLLFGWVAYSRYASTQDLWLQYNHRASDIGTSMLRVSNLLGYGGIIHDFKNLVLRRDLTRYKSQLDQKFALLKSELNHLEGMLIRDESKAQVQRIRETVLLYEKKYAEAQKMIAENKTAEQIDQHIKVDDRPALTALQALLERVHGRTTEMEAKAIGAYDGARYFMLLGGVLVALALLVTALVLFRNVRSIVQAHAETKLLQTKLDMLLDNAPDAMLTLDPFGLIQRSNQKAEQLFGYTRSELKDLSIEELLPQWNQHNLQMLTDEVVNLPVDTESDFKAKTRDGQRPDVEISFTSMGKQNNYLSTMTIRDISARKKAELAQHEATQRLALLVEASPAGIWRANAQGENIYASAQWCALTGLTVEQAIGDGWAAALHPDDRERIAGEWEEIVRTHARSYIARFRFLQPSGNVVWVICHGVAECRRSGEIVGWMGTVTDITSQIMMEEKLVAAKVAAEAASLAKSDFLANMSHEIRTPMNGIIGMTSLAMDATSDSQRQEYLEIVRASADSLLLIINDILDFSKIEAGKLTIEQIPFALQQTVQDGLLPLQGLANGKGLGYACDFDATLPKYVQGDPNRLRQVLTNLVANAIKFTERGEVRLYVETIKVQAQQRWVRFSVMDSGIGISPENLGKIFDSFSQADTSTSRKYGGTGLGLSISQRLVELMGGTLTVQSTLGVGSTFSFVLPLEVAVEPGQKPENSHKAVPGLSMRVLLVEDNLVNQKVACLMMKNWGHDVQTAENGQQAVDLIKTGERFDLIFMDMQMPVMDGIEATQLIRAWESSQGCVRHNIVALTANAMQRDQEICLAAGMDDYLAKPFEQEKLSSKLRLFAPHV